MNSTLTDPAFALVQKPRTRVVIKNSAGQIIFDSSINRNWNGYIVREIQEIRDGNDAPPSTYREFTGTYEVVLVGVGGVLYTLNDNQEPGPDLPSCVVQKPEEDPIIGFAPRMVAILCFNDNVAEFYD